MRKGTNHLKKVCGLYTWVDVYATYNVVVNTDHTPAPMFPTPWETDAGSHNLPLSPDATSQDQYLVSFTQFYCMVYC